MLIEIVAQLLFLASPILVDSTQVKSEPLSPTVPIVLTVSEDVDPDSLEDYIRGYFSDAPVLAEIAKCESTFRHLTKEGKIIRGKANRRDVGIMQINEYYHAERAKKLGVDLHTLDGNLAYAKWLYSKYGESPWKPSKKCWKEALSDNKKRG